MRSPEGIAHVSSSIDLSIGRGIACGTQEFWRGRFKSCIARSPQTDVCSSTPQDIKTWRRGYITGVSPTGYAGGGIKVRLAAARGGGNVTRPKFSVRLEGEERGEQSVRERNCRRRRFRRRRP